MSGKFFRALKRSFGGRQSVWLLIFSIAFAAVFWAYSVTGENSLKDLDVPVNFDNVPSTMMVSGEDASRMATVEFKGAPEVLKRIRAEDVEVKIDVTKLKPGPQIYTITRNDVRLPGSVDFVKAYPRVLHFTVGKRVSASVPIEPVFEGKPAEGSEVLGWSINPSTALIEGPEDIIKQIKKAPSQVIRLDGRYQDFSLPIVPTFKNEPDVSVLSSGPFMLTVTIGEKRVQRTIGPIRVRIRNARRPMIATPRSLEVMVDGPADIVNSLRPEDFTADVDVMNLDSAKGSYRILPAVKLKNPELAKSITVTGWNQRYVVIRVKKNPVVESGP